MVEGGSAIARPGVISMLACLSLSLFLTLSWVGSDGEWQGWIELTVGARDCRMEYVRCMMVDCVSECEVVVLFARGSMNPNGYRTVLIDLGSGYLTQSWV